MHHLRQLKKFGMNTNILLQFYRAAVESVLTFSITVWYGSATQEDRDRLEGVVKTASTIIGRQLPSVNSIYTDRLTRRARKITADPTHPAHSLFEPLRSGRRYRAIQSRTERFRRTFYPRAVLSISPP